MLQSLLPGRFQVAVHRDTRNAPGYALMPIKNGLKIRPDDTGGKSVWNSSRGKIVAQRITMARLAESLTRLLGTPVVDMTSATGVYTFTLEWTPEHQHSGGAPDGHAPEATAGPSLFDVLPEKLGLRLENRKLTLENLVIDKAERPSEN